MKLRNYTVALPVFTALALAQSTPPAKDKPPTDRPQEVKTQTYVGTLMDGACAAPASAQTSSADRSANTASCALSASSTQFALKTADGKTLRFDDVGNTRMQDALKTKKKWSDTITANKPLRVKASGLLNGDKLTVVEVD